MSFSAHWYVSQEELYFNSPSRRSGVSQSSELAHRQRCAHLIKKITKRLKMPYVCVLSAVVYMHRFFLKHSVLQFPVDVISMATLLLASKIEKHSRRLEDIVIHGHWCAFKICHNPKSKKLRQVMDDVVHHEKLLRQMFGFELKVEHPHEHIHRFCTLAGVPKSVFEVANAIASNSTMITTMCIRFKPTDIACLFVFLAASSTVYAHILPKRTLKGRPNIFEFFQDVKPKMLQSMINEFEMSVNDSESASLAHILEDLIPLGSTPTPPPESNKVNLPQEVSPDFVNSNTRNCSSSDSSESLRRNLKRPLQKDCVSSSKKMCINNNELIESYDDEPGVIYF